MIKWDETIDNLHREAYEKWMLREEIVPIERRRAGRNS
jgi:hypothetical protein